MQIDVTLKDIKTCRDKKFKGGFYHCPIELAAQRAMKQEVWSVGTEWLLATKDYVFYDLPPEAQRFATSYDSGAKVEPLVFEVTGE